MDNNPITPKEEYQLASLPKELLVKIAIELDPQLVAEKYKEGWTKQEILQLIKQHLSSSIGRTGVEGYQYIRNIQVGEPEEYSPELE